MRKSSASQLEASKKFMKHLKNSKDAQRQSAGKDKITKQINEQTPYASNYMTTASKPVVDIPHLLQK
jgi:hypothetical protein